MFLQRSEMDRWSQGHNIKTETAIQVVSRLYNSQQCWSIDFFYYYLAFFTFSYYFEWCLKPKVYFFLFYMHMQFQDASENDPFYICFCINDCINIRPFFNFIKMNVTFRWFFLNWTEFFWCRNVNILFFIHFIPAVKYWTSVESLHLLYVTLDHKS